MPPDQAIEPYHPRRTEFHGVRPWEDWRLKVYGVSYAGRPIDWETYEPAWSLVSDCLPRPAVGPDRPGVGFVIAHHGRNVHYFVVAWWDHENELPHRVFVRSLDGGAWRAATGGESFCVYDMEILWAERNAYVETVMAGSMADATDRYLERVATLTQVDP